MRAEKELQRIAGWEGTLFPLVRVQKPGSN